MDHQHGSSLHLGLLLLGKVNIEPALVATYLPDQDKIRPVGDNKDDKLKPFFSPPDCFGRSPSCLRHIQRHSSEA